MSKILIIFGSVAVFLVLAVDDNSLPEENTTNDSGQNTESLNSENQDEGGSQISTEGDEEDSLKQRSLLEIINDVLEAGNTVIGLGEKFMNLLS